MLSGLLFDRLTAARRSAVSFRPRRCLRARFSGSNCSACVDDCQSGALTLTGKTISFDEEKCSDCLRCSAICPNDALTDDIDLKLLFETVRNREKIVLSCVKGRQCEGKVNIPCIGFLSEPVLAALNILSKGNVVVDIERCGDCVNGHCLEKIRSSLSNIASRNPETFLLKIELAFNKDDIPGLDRNIARRFFLKDAKKAIINVSTDLITGDKNEPGQKDQHFEKNSTRNTVALNYVMEQTTDKDSRELLGTYYFRLEATKNCTSCPLCTGMCPTGALKREKEDNSQKLVFDGSRCSGCGLCVEFCKKDALTLLRADQDTAATTRIIA